MCVVCVIHSVMNKLCFMNEQRQRAWLQVRTDAPAKL